MPALLLPLIAGTVVAATPITKEPWFEFRDYPMKAFEKSAEGVTRFELLISPEGKIVDCKILSSSGNAELDETTCYLTRKRAQFRPARGENGAPAWGVYRSQALWALPDHRLIAPPAPDLEVSVNKLPDGAKQPPAVKLAYAVDPQGNTSSCTMMPSSLQQPKVMIDVGCRELLGSEKGKPVVGPSGQPVSAIKSGAVLFRAEPGSD